MHGRLMYKQTGRSRSIMDRSTYRSSIHNNGLLSPRIEPQQIMVERLKGASIMISGVYDALWSSVVVYGSPSYCKIVLCDSPPCSMIFCGSLWQSIVFYDNLIVALQGYLTVFDGLSTRESLVPPDRMPVRRLHRLHIRILSSLLLSLVLGLLLTSLVLSGLLSSPLLSIPMLLRPMLS